MKKRIWMPLAALPIAGLVAVLAPEDGDGYRRGCACISAYESFAYFIGAKRSFLSAPKFSDADVLAGFRKRFPPGTDLKMVDESGLSATLRDRTCARQGTNQYLCQYFYEENDEQRRGYAVTFDLDEKGLIKEVASARVAYKPLKR